MAVSKQEKFLAYNTLAVLLIALKEQYLQVETKNESTIIGTLQDCDGYGNLLLSKAKVISNRGRTTWTDQMHVKASAVRYVHLPDTINPLKAITTQLHSRKKVPALQMPVKYKIVKNETYK